MKCDHMKNLMMAFLDDEISGEEKTLFINHMRQCDVCAAEFEEFKKLKEVTDSMKLVEPEEKVWREYWSGIYNRIERSSGWILFSIGVIILLCYAGYKAVESLIADPDLDMFVKIAIFALIGGFSILLVSALRERLFFWKKDRYRYVRR